MTEKWIKRYFNVKEYKIARLIRRRQIQILALK